MKKLILITILFLSFSLLFSETVVPGGYVFGEWNLEGSPYLIEGDINAFASFLPLTIEPGCEIIFQGRYLFRVDGLIFAEGSLQDSIIFTAADPEEGWLGIRFIDPDWDPDVNDENNSFKHCRFEYGNQDDSDDIYSNGGVFWVKDFDHIDIDNCTFINNQSPNKGGALFLQNSNLEITNCQFINNHSGGGGGAIYADDSDLTISSSNFLNNHSETDAGAAYIYASEFNIDSCSFTGNEAENNWGALRLYSQVSGYLTNSLINQNISNDGTCISTSHNITIQNCSIINNSGGIFFTETRYKMDNCLIANNDSDGVRVFEWVYYPNRSINNCTIVNNLGYGIKLEYDHYYSQVRDVISLKNNIISGNVLGDIWNIYMWLSLEYSSFENELPEQAGPGCVIQNPYFVNPTEGAGSEYNSLEADWSLQPISLCINRGTPNISNLDLPEFDLAGNIRVYNNRIDMGAYEFQSEPDPVPNIIYPTEAIDLGNCPVGEISNSVSFTIFNSGTGDLEISLITSNNGFLVKKNTDTDFSPEISDIILSPNNNLVIDVACFPEESGILNGNITIESNDLEESIVELYLRANGINWLIVEGEINQDTFWDVDTVLVVGDIIINNDVNLEINEGVTIVISNNATFDVNGSIIAQGTENDKIIFTNLDDTRSTYWGGFKFEYSTQTTEESIFSHCIFEHSSSNNGAVFYIFNFSKLNISDCLFRDNHASFAGGAIYINSSNITIRNSQFTNNNSGRTHEYLDEWMYTDAGALFCNSTNLNLIDCEFSENKANIGGALQCNYSNVNINNSIFHNNEGVSNIWYIDEDWYEIEPGEAGGISATYSTINLRNSLCYDNEAGVGYGNFGNFKLSTLNFINSTFTRNGSNSSYHYAATLVILSSTINLTNSVLWDNYEQNIYLNNDFNQPGFANIQYSCLENGINSITTDSLTTLNWLEGNIESNPNFVDVNNTDYTLQSSSPCINYGTPDTTGLNLPEFDLAGNPCIYDGRVDMGCYEWQGVVFAGKDEVPGIVKLSNYPNPFNPETTISFNLPVDQRAKLTIYNLKGQKVRQFSNIINQNSIVWKGKDQSGNSVSSGIYFYKLEAGKTTLQKKMLLLK